MNYKSTQNFKSNDIFALSFNFINNTLIIFHNNIKADTVSLHYNRKITPAFSLYGKYTEIEVIKYEFIK